MTDKKISQLTNLTGANLANTDEFVVVDTSADETKAITWSELKAGNDTRYLQLSGGTLTGSVTASTLRVEPPSDVWKSSSQLWVDNLGGVYTHGSNRISMVSNGYRYGSSSLWQSLGVGGSDGAGIIEIEPTGKIRFGVELSKPTGSPSAFGLSAYIDYGTGNTDLPSDQSIVTRERGDVRYLQEADGDARYLQLSGGSITGNLGIGDSSPTNRLVVSRLGAALPVETEAQLSGAMAVFHSGTTTSGSGANINIIGGETSLNAIYFGSYDDPSNGRIQYDNSAQSFQFDVDGTETMRIDSSGNVGIGTSSPNAASSLDVQSTSKGVRFPNMTTTQKNAMSDVAGNVVFDITLGKLCLNTGSGWETITSS